MLNNTFTKININNIKSFVINLDDYIHNFNQQLPYLQKIKLNPVRYSAINAIKNDHIKYKNIINKLSYYFSPKSVIGCSLSHILLSKHILQNYNQNNNDNNNNNQNNNKNNYFLIMEDDVFPLEKYNNDSELFYNVLSNEINNINIIDPNWDIIQLHSDGIIDTRSTYNTHFFTGSTAAYLISINGLNKLSKEKVTYHIDFVTQNCIKYRKYRSRENLFYTNEKSSVNREVRINKSLTIKSNILKKFISLRGEKIWEDYLNFKTLRIPLFNKEFTANNLIDISVIMLILKTFLRNKYKLIN